MVGKGEGVYFVRIRMSVRGDLFVDSFLSFFGTR